MVLLNCGFVFVRGGSNPGLTDLLRNIELQRILVNELLAGTKQITGSYSLG